MNKDLIVIMILLALVALAHLINIDYENALESNNNTDTDVVENLVISDSGYSDCKVGCIIACTDKHRIFQRECYQPCVDQCWNY